MENNPDILKKVNRNDGLTVPEGFFEEFAHRMEQSLPYNAAAENPAEVQRPRTLWNRIRPYAYMAAMFAGIWCMLKMFTMMSPAATDLSIEGNHTLTEALADDNFVYDHILYDIDDQEIFDDMYDDSITVDEFTLAE